MNQNPNAATGIVVYQPGTDRQVWTGKTSTASEVQQAVASARSAFSAWQSKSQEARFEVASRFAELAHTHQSQLSERISMETGKPRWEADGEARLIATKVQLSIDAYRQRCNVQRIDLPQGVGEVGYRSVGVMAVIGPFNFPAHLPNGHMVPALIAGNTVVFKPSELTPGTGELLVRLWQQAGLPRDVLQLVHGGRDIGAALVDSDVDGVLFTGSYAGGTAIHRALAGRPTVLLALEMGGNNPLVVGSIRDLDAAAYLIAVSAFITAGQRCTCARRLILTQSQQSPTLIERVVTLARSMRVGLPDDQPQPFLGTLISAAAADRVLDAQATLEQAGGDVLCRCRRLDRNPALLTPGIVDVTDIDTPVDDEIFGPLLQVVRVSDFDAALCEANRTQYGLAATLLSDDAAEFERFRGRVRAGVINWNQPTVGASGRLPFGGLGASGNHRPSGFFAADYCSDATAVLQNERLAMPQSTFPGIDL